MNRRYVVHGVDVALHGDAAVLASIHTILEHAGFALAQGQNQRPQVVLHCSSAPGAVQVPPTARVVAEQSGIRASECGEALYLTCEGHACGLDLSAGVAEVVVPPRSEHLRKDFLTYALLLLLRRRGLYGLHASGVARNGVGCLFIAPSGSGKSTQTYSLVRQGWAYLGDDSILLRDDGEHVAALALRRDLCLDPVLAHAFPEVDSDGRKDSFAARGKRRLPMRALHGGALIDRCAPRLLVFPEIVSSSASRLVPLDAAEALVRLTRESVVVGLDPQVMPLHLRVLARLIRQARCWFLLAGRDLKARPDLVAPLLDAALATIGPPSPGER